MRIAMFTETFLPSTDGIVTRLVATLVRLQQEGHEVLLFAPDGAPPEYAGAKIVSLPSMRFFLYPEKRFPMPSRKVRKPLLEFQPDLVHTLNPAFIGLSAIYYAWRHNLPLVASYHTNVPAYARHYRLDFLEPALWWYFRTLHNRAVMNLCTSRATQEILVQQGFKNVELWERGVDLDRYRFSHSTPEMRRKLAPTAKESDKILLYVGRLAFEKHIEQLRECLTGDTRYHLAIVGDGPHRKALESYFAGTRTKFLGYLHGTDLAEAYRSADVFAFPSTTETLGLVLFEAMASGLPILAADSPPTREILEGGDAGYIYDSTQPGSILSTANRIFEENDRLNRVCARAEEISSTLDWDRPTEQLISHYESVLGLRTAPMRSMVSGRSHS
ncbi:glycosyltransferase family 1 protein [Alicyclobacillus sp. SP_1]|uniref:glycosyltransferase family 4 protein n=1 Tax=Alicyclobacillus sp. SP_1 TaxID=2942475 RepID=UPI00215846B5|nr:glycosyltransferase family 1 protein [Alicyclobacillus sp. SP_1]